MRGYLRPRDRRKPERRKGGCRTWQLVVEGERLADGRRRQDFRAFSGTKAEAEAALRRFVDEAERGEVVASKGVALAEWTAKWLARKTVGRRSVKPRTIESYESLLRLHVLPRLGHLPIAKLTRPAVQRLADDLLREGRLSKGREGGALSAQTVRRVVQAMRASLDAAVRADLIHRNVAAGVEIPEAAPSPARAVPMDDVLRLVGAAAGTRLELPILVAATSGLRRGEIFGLAWEHVDFEERIILVRRQLGRKRVLGAPKSRAGIRDVPIPAFVSDRISQHRLTRERLCLQLDIARVETEFVFCEADGTAWEPDGISTLWRRIVRDAGVGPLRFHDLRHSAGSMMIASGVPVPVVSEILGHSNPATTMRIYAHALRGGREHAAAAMHERLAQAMQSGAALTPPARATTTRAGSRR